MTKIGIIGTGNMGRTIGTKWAGLGHDVMFGSRDPHKASEVARAVGARSGDANATAAHADIILYTVRGVLPSTTLADRRLLDGKIVIDCNNSDYDAATGEFLPAPIPSYAEQLAADVPGARVVQAFSTIPHRVLELPRAVLEPQRVSAFVCSDDAGAKAAVARLAGELGLVPIDTGGLRRARIIDGVVALIRFQIAGMNRGPFTAISMVEVARGAS